MLSHHRDQLVMCDAADIGFRIGNVLFLPCLPEFDACLLCKLFNFHVEYFWMDKSTGTQHLFACLHMDVRVVFVQECLDTGSVMLNRRSNLSKHSQEFLPELLRTLFFLPTMQP